MYGIKIAQIAGKFFAWQNNVSDIVGLRSDCLVQRAEIVVTLADGPRDRFNGLQGLGGISHQLMVQIGNLYHVLLEWRSRSFEPCRLGPTGFNP